MKAITIRQPFLSLMSRGLKKYLTFDYGSTYMGLIFLRADTAQPRRREVDAMIAASPVGSLGSNHAYLYTAEHPGCLMIAAQVVSATPIDAQLIAQQTPLERAIGRWQEGSWAWKVAKYYVLSNPIKVTGRTGLWTLPSALEVDIKTQLPSAFLKLI